jgi:hypothetical protein
MPRIDIPRVNRIKPAQDHPWKVQPFRQPESTDLNAWEHARNQQAKFIQKARQDYALQEGDNETANIIETGQYNDKNNRGVDIYG